jgi:hypothetical protein
MSRASCCPAISVPSSRSVRGAGRTPVAVGPLPRSRIPGVSPRSVGGSPRARSAPHTTVPSVIVAVSPSPRWPRVLLGRCGAPRSARPNGWRCVRRWSACRSRRRLWRKWSVSSRSKGDADVGTTGGALGWESWGVLKDMRCPQRHGVSPETWGFLNGMGVPQAHGVSVGRQASRCCVVEACAKRRVAYTALYTNGTIERIGRDMRRKGCVHSHVYIGTFSRLFRCWYRLDGRLHMQCCICIGPSGYGRYAAFAHARHTSVYCFPVRGRPERLECQPLSTNVLSTRAWAISPLPQALT